MNTDSVSYEFTVDSGELEVSFSMTVGMAGLQICMAKRADEANDRYVHLSKRDTKRLQRLLKKAA